MPRLRKRGAAFIQHVIALGVMGQRMFCRHLGHATTVVLGFFLCPLLFAQQPPPETVPIRLQVNAGTPLRLYTTQRAWYRKGEIVHAKFAEPVWAFDRIVIPAGTVAEGRVVDLHSVPPIVRAMAVVRGDFTPLKRAQVSFTSLLLPDGQTLPLDTRPVVGLATIFVPPRPAKNKSTNNRGAKLHKPTLDPNSKRAQFRALVKQQAQAQANARTEGFLDFVRGPNKREWVENFFWGKLPYHPQWYRTGTRFDAELDEPLDFGNAMLDSAGLQALGSQPLPDIPVLVRILSTVSSADAHVGDPITGVLSQPLFSLDHRLSLPEGTRLNGKVTLARPARMFHRGGQLRFAFDSVQPPLVGSAPAGREPVQTDLTDAEQGKGYVKVDAEGTAQATESKTRFLRPLVAGLIAAKSADNDTGKQTASSGPNANYSGRSLGGFSGFGLFGTALARGPKPIGAALGYYGLAWSIYSTLISRGQEVTFQNNSAIAIRFAPPSRKGLR